MDKLSPCFIMPGLLGAVQETIMAFALWCELGQREVGVEQFEVGYYNVISQCMDWP